MSDPPKPQLGIGEIDPEALKRWFAVEPNTLLHLHATRAEMDAFFIGLRDVIIAHGHTLATIKALAEKNQTVADENYRGAVEKHFEALRNVTDFMSAIMKRATAE